MRFIKEIVFLLVLICVVQHLRAQDYTTSELPTLKDVIKSGLANNYNIKVNKKLVEISVGNMISSGGLFNSSLTSGISAQPGVLPSGSSKDNYTFSVGFVKPTKIGIDFSSGLDYVLEKTVSNPNKQIAVNGAWLQMDMPLLKGLGKNNLDYVNYKISKLNVQSVQANFEYNITIFIKNIIIAYSNVYINEKLYNSYNVIYNNIEQLFSDTKLLVNAKLIPQTDLINVEAEKYRVKIELKTAKNNLATSYINLLKLMGNNTSLVFLSDSLFIPFAIPELQPKALKSFVQQTLLESDTIAKKALNYQEQILKQMSAATAVTAAKNDKLNELDLKFKYNYYTEKQGVVFDDSFIIGNSYFPGSSYLISLNYQIPFKNEQARGNFIVKNEEYKMQNELSEKLLFDIKKAIENTAIKLQYNYDNYLLQKENTKLQKKIYTDQILKFQTKNSTILDVIKTHSDYTTSLDNMYQLEFEVVNSLITLKFLRNQMPKNILDLETFEAFKLK